MCKINADDVCKIGKKACKSTYTVLEYIFLLLFGIPYLKKRRIDKIALFIDASCMLAIPDLVYPVNLVS
jgi:hypothetical protein